MIPRPPVAAALVLAVLAAGCAGGDEGGSAHRGTPTRFRSRCRPDIQYRDVPMQVQAPGDRPRIVHDLLCKDELSRGDVVDVRIVRTLRPTSWLMRFTATSPDGTQIEQGVVEAHIDPGGTIGHVTAR